MLDLLYNVDDFEISSIYESDVSYLKQWINNMTETNENVYNIETDEIYERYLEYIVSEGEIFLKILKKNLIIGLLKGRVEFGEGNKVWFSNVIIDTNEIGMNEKLDVINRFLNALTEEFGISEFLISIASNDKENLKFWRELGFDLNRISKNYYEVNGKALDMMVLKRYS